jgi:hypothetical protein
LQDGDAQQLAEQGQQGHATDGRRFVVVLLKVVDS